MGDNYFSNFLVSLSIYFFKLFLKKLNLNLYSKYYKIAKVGI